MPIFIIMSCCYILISEKFSRFYWGSTELQPEMRLEMHNKQHYGNTKYTAKTNDWELFLVIDCIDIAKAQKIERYIKRMKSQKFIKKLKVDDKRVQWLLDNI